MTKEKVIDILEGIKDGTACLMPNMPEDGEKAIDIAIKAVEQLEPHWIPVTEKLPEVKQRVIVQYVDGCMAIKRCIDAGHLQWFYANAVAWIPAPEPYKEEIT